METDQEIKREAIPFLPLNDKTKTSFLEVKYSNSGSSFKTQLPIFCGGSAEEFLLFPIQIWTFKSKGRINNISKTWKRTWAIAPRNHQGWMEYN